MVWLFVFFLFRCFFSETRKIRDNQRIESCLGKRILKIRDLFTGYTDIFVGILM